MLVSSASAEMGRAIPELSEYSQLSSSEGNSGRKSSVVVFRKATSLQVNSLQEHNRSPHRSTQLLSKAKKSEGAGAH